MKDGDVCGVKGDAWLGEEAIPTKAHARNPFCHVAIVHSPISPSHKRMLVQWGLHF